VQILILTGGFQKTHLGLKCSHILHSSTIQLIRLALDRDFLAALALGGLMFSTRTVQPDETHVLHHLYSQSERYFEIIAAPMPLPVDVQHELETALTDSRRHLEFVHMTGVSEPVGYVDLTFDYPQLGDVTINLLLIGQPWQASGVGSWTARDLEDRLQSGALRSSRVKRVLAGIYGDNPGAVRFWERLGYAFAIDARPVLSWYAKDLGENDLLEREHLTAQR
jgi:GNAT superfamily N-acetyltransferase